MKRTICRIILFYIPLVAWLGCYGQPTGMVLDKTFDKKLAGMLDAQQVPFMSVTHLAKAKDEYIILDAREREEFDVSHIPGAIWIGYDDFNWDRVQEIDPSKAVVVYCSVGYRSEKIGQQLQRKIPRVYNLYGSIFEWVNQSYPVVQGVDTVDRVHTYNKAWSKWVTRPDVKKVY